MNSPQSKTLFLLTSSYPYEPGEIFLENEIKYISHSFENIIIICSSSPRPTDSYLPAKTKIIHFTDSITTSNKANSLRFLFSKIIWDEFCFIRNILKLKLTIKRIKILLIDYEKAYRLKGILNRELLTMDMAITDIYMYSYWNDYKSVACGMIKEKYPLLKTFARAHGWDLYMERSDEQYLSFKNYIWNSLDKTFFISEYGYKEALKILKLNSLNRFSISKLGTFNTTEPDFTVNRESLVIVSCSFIYAIKRIDLLIKTLALFEDRKIEWHHFGIGDDYEKNLLEAKSLLVNKNVVYKFHGHVPNSEILNFYKEKNVDLLINVSSTEGLPVSIMEAMSMGIPVIATSVGGIPEIVNHNYNGWLLSANPKTQEIYSAIMTYVYLSDNEIINYKINAYNTWKESFNAEINFTKFLAKINQI